MSKKTWIAGILGALAGIPLSYYFQPGIDQSRFNGISDYLGNLGTVADSSVMLHVLNVTVMASALFGGAVTWLADFIEYLIKK